ncbi:MULTISPECIES: ribosome maturation factor RimM [unclassified Shimia]|uniref:ribosome maturation factor RimM n=1 Tax=unclassified Shimia TaxID=2630038 RepID=UPI001ADC8A5E|nr:MULTISPECIES: ribosome maturation factor RimM [unclassified Shimia]MBO9397710.1 16S rRNA processing protein RimM [Shimia sp. R9_2]MBO9402277.1 16S rRNA processing protein RimM [Shimia sp. R9_3]
MSDTPSDLICVGAIGGAYGVRGEVRLKSFTAEADAIADYAPLLTEDGAFEFTVTITRAIKNGLAARLSGIATKEQADALKGVKLFVPRDRLPETDDDEYYYTDLVGLEVRDTGGAALGTVKTVVNHGSTDLLEVLRPGSAETVLLPFTLAAVPTVDIASGRIIADPPEGLFD